MAKKYGKRRKSGAGEPRDLFGAPPPPRPAAARPASSTPLADYLSANWPGVSEGYVVLPRSLAEAMSLPWQQQMSAMLAQFHQTHRGLDWPVYRVVPSRHENLVDLDEEQLAEAGYIVEIDTDGELVYRERSGRKVEDPANTTVLVSCLDPIPPRGSARAAEAAQAEPDRPRAAPMIIPPAPVWRNTPTSPSPSVPPLPETPNKTGTPAAGVPAQSAPEDPQGAAGQAPSAPAGWGQAPAGPSSQPLPAQPLGGPSSQPLPAQAPAESPQAEQPAQEGESPQAQWAPPQPPSAQTPVPAETPPSQPPPQEPPAPAPEAPQPPVGWAQVAPPKAQEPRPASDEDTPPRGLRLDRGWFDPLPGEASSDEPADFGPTGDPTELPYRYRP
ncbi:hypothetical protein HFP15_31380 [Amycolatopsis sp. K13G38]|uniref:Uncharacterized protein n=1 Tax=Amycolatopsis acididurans TaxID=2724524 RepID=A0ABX1JFT6_9PSEU|nr:hypothetical protein [Amycolatopsis acididurans]NKQ57376.1 hypothetical protein [Amycolatopsis acididurans]